MRPRYETPEQRAAEALAARRYASLIDVELFRAPPTARVDWVTTLRKQLHAVLEVKCRHTVKHTDYTQYLVSAEKIWFLRLMAETLAIRPILVVEWSDAIGALDLTEEPTHEHRPGGRVDRGDPADRGLCVYPDISKFRIWEGSPHERARRPLDHQLARQAVAPAAPPAGGVAPAQVPAGGGQARAVALAIARGTLGDLGS